MHFAPKPDPRGKRAKENPAEAGLGKFGRGCLKGRFFMTPARFLCKCEIQNECCKERKSRRRNRNWRKSATRACPPSHAALMKLIAPCDCAAPHNGAHADFGQKKAQPLPVGPWKFWERMPKRPVPYAHRGALQQMRIRHGRLREMHRSK